MEEMEKRRALDETDEGLGHSGSSDDEQKPSLKECVKIRFLIYNKTIFPSLIFIKVVSD